LSFEDVLPVAARQIAAVQPGMMVFGSFPPQFAKLVKRIAGELALTPPPASAVLERRPVWSASECQSAQKISIRIIFAAAAYVRD